jgi:predicted NUDIX family NTP pyrophosphohydrolase
MAAKTPNVSAGLILFRRRAPDGALELFLAHPGGPFWAHRDDGAWTIPKGIVNPGEDLLAGAQREFTEETGVEPRGPFLSLGSVKQKAGKTVHAWAWEGDADPARVTSNTMRTEWPRGSGRQITFPEVDRCAWFDPDAARVKLNAAQSEFVARLETAVRAAASGAESGAERGAESDARLDRPR